MDSLHAMKMHSHAHERAVDAAIRFMAEGKGGMHGEKKTSTSGDITYNTGTSHLHMTDEFKDKKAGICLRRQ